ncbi:hypothetical protein NX862_15090 [Rhodobacter sp. KR11]|uniref:hypothetical protein n=1 Tax=Rhodobacter sp. KR11 TaxID=2974588 RepID=UPI002222ACD9|nr:hypothetical protein [Rhodobacter sp. KR11]MCW1920084.1 hypothetical protein [Rhodobacter sp. KR11]
MAALMASPVRAGGHADAILLSCMDFRLIDDLAIMMNQMQYRNSYDHVILAGGALGAVHPQFEPWHDVFWEHVGLAVKLHSVREIVVIDHRDCGAAKLALGEDVVADPQAELAAHTAVLAQFSEVALQRFPELHVKGFLMNLDGSVERLRPEAMADHASASDAEAAQNAEHGAEGGGDHAAEEVTH